MDMEVLGKRKVARRAGIITCIRISKACCFPSCVFSPCSLQVHHLVCLLWVLKTKKNLFCSMTHGDVRCLHS